MTHDEDEFIARALGHLPREMAPPAGLEDATVRRLRAAGVLRPPMRLGLSVASWLLAAGVAGIAFVGGSVFATRMSSPSARAAQATHNAPDAQNAQNASNTETTPAQEPTFALLLYGASSGDDSATHAARAVEYGKWARSSHAAAARVVGGEALGTAVASVALATVRRGVDSIIVDDSPDGAGDFVGYYLVQAPNREAALALARNCPHLKYGGRVVVRRVWPSAQSAAVVPVRDSGAP